MAGRSHDEWCSSPPKLQTRIIEIRPADSNSTLLYKGIGTNRTRKPDHSSHLSSSPISAFHPPFVRHSRARTLSLSNHCDSKSREHWSGIPISCVYSDQPTLVKERLRYAVWNRPNQSLVTLENSPRYRRANYFPKNWRAWLFFRIAWSPIKVREYWMSLVRVGMLSTFRLML